jgi:hypothetical protein
MFASAKRGIYIRIMGAGAASTSYRETDDSRAKLYWFDIDVVFDDITRQPSMMPSAIVISRPISPFQYSILHGVGTVANALSVGDTTKSFDRFKVDVAALTRADDEFEPPDLHRSARMVWNEVDVYAPRLQIHVQTRMLRHLVELYVTKRIDTILMSMKIAVERQAFVEMRANPELLPVLDNDGRLYFRRTHCELLSVQASLAHERIRRSPQS